MKKATLKNVAEHAGVSTATVSYVLNGKNESISEETKERIMRVVEELGYFTNMNAKSLVMNDSKLVGVVIPQTEDEGSQLMKNAFYSEIISSVEHKARERGYQIIISGVEVNETYLKIAHERNLDGVIAIGVYQDEFFEQLEKTGIPVVLVDSYSKDKKFSNVRIDDEYGSYLATKYMIEKGHQKIGFLSGLLKENGVMQKRFQGYKEALSESNIEYREENVFEGKVGYSSGMDFAYEMVKRKMDLTAVVTTADILAIGFMKGMSQQKYKIPEDVSVIGFDDLEICQYLTPGLSTIKQQISEKGECAMELLFSQMNGSVKSTDIVLPVEIVERDSVREMDGEQ